MTIGLSTSSAVHNFADDTPRRRSIENPPRPGVDQLAVSQGRVKVNSTPLAEPITLPSTRQNLDAAIERAQLGAARRQAADLSSSSPRSAAGLMSTFLKG